MAFDRVTAARVRRILSDRGDVAERPMFGGLAFMVANHMCCCVGPARLMVRVGAAARAQALAMPHVGPVVMGARTMAAFVSVDPAGYATDAALAEWVDRGRAFALALPPKPA
jgi:hypothetical protein